MTDLVVELAEAIFKGYPEYIRSINLVRDVYKMLSYDNEKVTRNCLRTAIGIFLKQQIKSPARYDSFVIEAKYKAHRTTDLYEDLYVDLLQGAGVFGGHLYSDEVLGYWFDHKPVTQHNGDKQSRNPQPMTLCKVRIYFQPGTTRIDDVHFYAEIDR